MGSAFRLNQRSSGVLLHPTSLPGPAGCGDLGPGAYRFVDFLAAAGQRWWQMLPIGPPGPGNAPYSAMSAFGGSPWLVSPEAWSARARRGRHADATAVGMAPFGRVNFGRMMRARMTRLRAAFGTFRAQGGEASDAFGRFAKEQAAWLDDFALFCVLKRRFRGKEWAKWPAPLRERNVVALREAREALADEIAFEKFVQFQFDWQWAALREYAHERGVGLIGDIPIFVAYDSADVWAQRELFLLDARGRPIVVSGCPPDAFNRNGQLWGHAHYRWPRHAADGYAWWVERFAATLRQFDAVRIDHFLGFHRVWAVLARAKTARNGRWMKTPGEALFAALRRALGRIPAIAEDLGATTAGAERLRDRYEIPGMRVLQFAFGSDGAGSLAHRPDHWPRRCVGYTGTHDNETSAGWFTRLAAEAAKLRAKDRGVTTEYDRAQAYLDCDRRNAAWRMIEAAMASAADTVIFPMQDALQLGNRDRMNIPGVAKGNWAWRMLPGAASADLARRLRSTARKSKRVRLEK